MWVKVFSEDKGLYKTCVRTAMISVNELWALKQEEKGRVACQSRFEFSGELVTLMRRHRHVIMWDVTVEVGMDIAGRTQ